MSLSKFFHIERTPRIVEIAPSGVSFEARKNQTLLEAGLAQGLAMPHSCTVGTCGSCKCKLVSGKIRELTNFAYILEEDDLRNNYILTCQASAKENVILEIPDFEPKKLHPPENFKGRIVETSKVTHDILKVELELNRPMKFDAGQYLQLHVPQIYGARSYSFAMAPNDEGNQLIELFIRLVPQGEFTTRLFDGAMAGMELDIHGPSGNFWLREGDGPIVCIAGGSGLAPILSILEQALKNSTRRPCFVFFGARTQKDLYGLDRMKLLKEKWTDIFEFVPVLSHEPDDSDWTGHRGFVNTVITDVARNYLTPLTDIYMCGPPPMIDASIDTLKSAGIDERKVHFDKFLDASHGVSRHD